MKNHRQCLMRVSRNAGKYSVMSAVMVMVLLADKTEYILNLMVQSFGYHFQHFTALR